MAHATLIEELKYINMICSEMGNNFLPYPSYHRDVSIVTFGLPRLNELGYSDHQVWISRGNKLTSDQDIKIY